MKECSSVRLRIQLLLLRETEGRQFPAVYGLFEVEGEAIVKDHSDAGFVMQNMKVIGKPLLAFFN